MPNLTETLTSKLGLFLAASGTVSAIAGFIFWSIDFLDARHASAMDMKNMAQMMKASEIARIEYQIEDAQRKMTRIIKIPEPERTRDEVGELEDLKYKKEYLKRELDRLEDD